MRPKQFNDEKKYLHVIIISEIKRTFYGGNCDYDENLISYKKYGGEFKSIRNPFNILSNGINGTNDFILVNKRAQWIRVRKNRNMEMEYIYITPDFSILNVLSSFIAVGLN